MKSTVGYFSVVLYFNTHTSHYRCEPAEGLLSEGFCWKERGAVFCLNHLTLSTTFIILPISLQFSSLGYTSTIHQSKNSSQLSPKVQYIHLFLRLPPLVFDHQTLDCIFWQLSCLPPCFINILKVYDLFSSLINVFLVHSLLCMMYFCLIWIQQLRMHGDV